MGAATVNEAYLWKESVIDNGEELYKNNKERYRKFVVSGNIRKNSITWEDKKVR